MGAGAEASSPSRRTTWTTLCDESDRACAHRALAIRHCFAGGLGSPAMDEAASLKNGRQRSEMILICDRILRFCSAERSVDGSACFSSSRSITRRCRFEWNLSETWSVPAFRSFHGSSIA